MNQFKQQGFTLIELMIALALGLVIVAAVITLFITGQKSYNVQQGVAENQNNANFGLNLITQDVRHANLNGASGSLNDRKLFGGVVLTSVKNAYIDTANGNAKLSNLPPTIPDTVALETLLTRSNTQTVATTGNAWSGKTNVTLSNGTAVQSDQLVVQYLPLEEMIGRFDCEGNPIANANEYVIQRYFLRLDANAATTEPNEALSLACDAGRIAADNPTAITGYGDAGQIIMQRVDHFRVLLGVQQENTYRFIDAATYMALPSSATVQRPNIISIQIGALSRAVQSAGVDNLIKNDQIFKVLDQDVKVKATTTPSKYVRQVVSQTIALRNSGKGG